jgi:CBS domain-containing protein
MKIKDRPEYSGKTDILTFRPDDTLSEAIKVMSEKNFGSCLIANEDKTLAGIITERDLMRRVLSKGLDPAKLKIKEVMTTNLRVAKPDDDVLDWMRIMSNERFRHLPIVDDQNKIVSIMSQGDFVSYTWPELMVQFTEKAKETIRPNYQIFLILGSVMAYTLLMMLIFGQL